MHTFTSNSNDRTPHLPYGRTWMLVIILLVAWCALAEGTWRALEYKPSATDNDEWWAYHRGLVGKNDTNSIVLLGSSRILADISTRELHERLPGYSVAWLGVPSTSPVAALKDLARDSEFKGFVIVEWDAALLLADEGGISRPGEWGQVELR